MKPALKFTILIFAIITISSCKKDKSESFVDDYSPKLTEEAGIEYAEDYFPVETGYNWSWDGTEKLKGVTSFTSAGENTKVPIDEVVSGYSHRYFGEQISIKLETGKYNVYPSFENTYSGDNSQNATRFFEKTSDAVYIRAISVNGGSTIEVKNPVFLRKPLIVGDSWQTEPAIDMKKAMESSSNYSQGVDVDLNIKCMIYVVGKETKQYLGDNIETIRLDERAEAKASIDYNEDGVVGSVSLLMQLDCRLNFLKNVGLTHQQSEYTIVINGSLNASGQKLTYKVNLTTEGNYTLTDFITNLDYQALVNKPAINKNASGRYIANISKNAVINKQIEQAITVAELIKKVLR